MRRLPPALRRACVPAPLVLVLAALALSGCGGDTKTNGLEKLSAGQVQRRAAAALESAKSAHVKGTGVFEGYPVQMDLRISGSATSGALAAEGVRFEITKIGAITYVKGSAPALRKLGASAAAARVGADRWLKLGSKQVTLWDGFSLAELADQLVHDDSPVDPRVTQATLDGRQVVVLTQQNGSKLYVANTGRAYPLRGEYTGPAAARIDFTEYGTDFRITAPENAIDVAKQS
jgi:nucleoid-associated protein YgaU